MRPLSGWSRPPARCRRVDLPDPLGPTRARNSPSSSSRSTSSRATTSSRPRWKRFDTASRLSRAISATPCRSLRNDAKGTPHDVGHPPREDAAVTALELLAACLAEAGVASVFGAPLAWLTAVPALEPELASLLADADGRMGPGPGAALLPGQVLRLSSRPGGVAEPVVVRSAAEIPIAASRAAAIAGGP